LNQERIAYRQKYAKRIKELASSALETSQAMNVERKLLSGLQALDNVKEIVIGLIQLQPHLHEVLSRVLAMTDSSLDIIILA
jgi:hypothetical protein